jgi:LAO/AO transport system kinase
MPSPVLTARSLQSANERRAHAVGPRDGVVTRPTQRPDELAAALRARELDKAPAVLNLLERDDDEGRAQAAELLAAFSPQALGSEPNAQIIGFTGPPGVGKSTLLAALVEAWREQARSVAVLAVDPSSKRSGGALLGDRGRIAKGAGDQGLFIRSMAAGERLGGLSPATRAAAQALASAFDIVAIETVGVGQSETEVAELADTVVVVVQPGSGDALQFLKSGIMEIPDLIVVAKADLGPPAVAMLADARAELRALGRPTDTALALSAIEPRTGIDELVAALDKHHAALDLPAHRLQTRRAGALAEFIAEYGNRGLRAVGGRREAQRILAAQDPKAGSAALLETLAARAAGP